jgi:two-component system sensor histidine kinase AlgZ
MLRVFLLVNALAIATVLVSARDWQQWWDAVGVMAIRIEFPLMLTLLGLYAVAPAVAALPRRRAWAAAASMGAAAVVTWGLLLEEELPLSLWRWLAWAIAASGVVFLYFDYRDRRLSPALSEARLIALTARIRPHFLFNSLNAVLGVIRGDPRRAEVALEELADLFRVLMRDNRRLVTLAEEIRLCQRYLDLERLRLGERLSVRWHDAECPHDAGLPPLMLQPLIENAVYHGVEPSSSPGPIDVEIGLHGSELRIQVANDLPSAPERRSSHAAGSRIALANLRERLMLYYDLEASLVVQEHSGRFEVRVKLPYRRLQGNSGPTGDSPVGDVPGIAPRGPRR